MVDTPDLGSGAERCVGSSPILGNFFSRSQMILYIYSKCSTCKEALSYLKELGIDVVVREITETPPSIDELNAMLHYQEDNLKKLFNTSGNLYREMQLAEKLPNMALLFFCL